MTLNDFTVGQTVYGIFIINSVSKIYKLIPYTVVSIGKKYLKAQSEERATITNFYVQSEHKNFLTEKVECGFSPTMLFLTKKEAAEYIEFIETIIWLLNTANNYNFWEKFDIEQLREIKSILKTKTEEQPSLKDLFVGQQVFILEKQNAKWRLMKKKIGYSDSSNVVTVEIGLCFKSEFILAHPDDNYLTEVDPDESERFLFTSEIDALEFMLSHKE